MGWEEVKVAVEYDGDQHRSDRQQYVKDIRRLAALESRGWIVIRVIAEDHSADVVNRVRNALARRGLFVEINISQTATRTFAA
jgi:very-short-patch-repair endonuclease